MRTGLVLAGLTAVLGAGMATPAFAETGNTVSVCDSLLPSCVGGVFISPLLVGGTTSDMSVCKDAPPIPTLTSYCVYVEVDVPVAAA